jgi:hypothetical protein
MFPHKDDLHKRYFTYSTERLLSIFYNRGQYTDQALEVVKSELARRNITSHDVDLFLDEQEEQKLAARAHSYIPLTFWEKSLFFFAWFAPWFLGKAFRLNYSDDGYLLKAKQSAIFARAGFAFLMLDAFVTVYFDLGNVISIVVLVSFFLIFYGAEKQFSYEVGREYR